MALLERLSANGPDKLSVHQFYSAMVEWGEGGTTFDAIVAHFELDASDEVDLLWLRGKYDISVNKREFAERLHGMLLLAEDDYPGYTTKNELVALITSIG